MSKLPIPEDLKELIKELIIIEKEKKRKQQIEDDLRERLYDYDYYQKPQPEEKPTKIVISLE